MLREDWVSVKHCRERLLSLAEQKREEVLKSVGRSRKRASIPNTVEKVLTEYGIVRKGITAGNILKVLITITAVIGAIVAFPATDSSLSLESLIPYVLVCTLSFGPIIAAAWSPKVAIGVRVFLGAFMGLLASLLVGLTVNALSLAEGEEVSELSSNAIEAIFWVLVLLGISWGLLMTLEEVDKWNEARSRRCRRNLNLWAGIGEELSPQLVQVDRGRPPFDFYPPKERPIKWLRTRRVTRWILSICIAVVLLILCII